MRTSSSCAKHGNPQAAIFGTHFLFSATTSTCRSARLLRDAVYRGLRRSRPWWDNEIVPNWEAFETVADFRRVGTRLVVLGHWRARGRTSRLRLDMPATWVVDVRGGKIARWQTFTNRAEALEAVGVSEQDAHADS